MECLSCNVYITNFPLHLYVWELWRICEHHRKVTDIYIPKKLSKLGKPFDFVRFNRVNNMKALIDSLLTIRIGKKWMLVNIARFNRHFNNISKIIDPLVKPNDIFTHASRFSYANVVCGGTSDSIQKGNPYFPILVLDRGDLNWKILWFSLLVFKISKLLGCYDPFVLMKPFLI